MNGGRYFNHPIQSVGTLSKRWLFIGTLSVGTLSIGWLWIVKEEDRTMKFNFAIITKISHKKITELRYLGTWQNLTIPVAADFIGKCFTTSFVSTLYDNPHISNLHSEQALGVNLKRLFQWESALEFGRLFGNNNNQFCLVLSILGHVLYSFALWRVEY